MLVHLTQYCAGDNIEKIGMGWACGAHGWGEVVLRILVGKPEGKRPLGSPRRRWVDNIRTYIQEVECGYKDWIGLAQDREMWRSSWVRLWTSGFREMRGISQLAAYQLASQEGICTMEWVSKYSSRNMYRMFLNNYQKSYEIKLWPIKKYWVYLK